MSIEARIAELDAQITALREERARLSKLLSQPLVEPVQHYLRHHSEYREPYDGTLEEAYRSLEFMSDDGLCYAVGIEVNGVEHSMDDLRDRYEHAAS